MARAIVETSISPQKFEDIKNNLVDFYTKTFKNTNDRINDVVILRKSLDARKRDLKYNLRLEAFSGEDFPSPIQMPEFEPLDSNKAVHIIGFGPAGIFAALKCLELGIKPIVIEKIHSLSPLNSHVSQQKNESIFPNFKMSLNDGLFDRHHPVYINPESLSLFKNSHIVDIFNLLYILYLKQNHVS